MSSFLASRVVSRSLSWTRFTKFSQLRLNSSNAGPKEVSPHVAFYKTFTRPVAKVMLMAVFTYQLAYWGWAKLEKEELKREKKDEIAVLESQLAALKNGGKEQKP